MGLRALRRIHKAFFRARGFYPASLGGHAVRVDPDHMEFWQAATANQWEPYTFQILSRYLTPDTTYYDIGAWIGPTVIYASGRCKKVVCLEPDPVAFRYLLWNLHLNALPNVLPLNVALADQDAPVRMKSFGVLGDSMTSMLAAEQDSGSAEVPALRWKTLLSLGLAERPDVIKIDIEGSEFSVLPSLTDYLRAHRPTLYLSTHTPWLPPGQRADAMATVLDIVAHYKTCLNEQLEPMDPESLLSDQALAQFHSIVLVD